MINQMSNVVEYSFCLCFNVTNGIFMQVKTVVQLWPEVYIPKTLKLTISDILRSLTLRKLLEVKFDDGFGGPS